MDDHAKKKMLAPWDSGVERRKHPRHKYVERIIIENRDATWTAAMSFEISAGGMSVATAKEFAIGQRVKLSPVVGKKVEAIIRRKKGSMYGLEFLELTAQVKADIEKLCEALPPFRSMADV
jgi:hypothetical protein